MPRNWDWPGIRRTAYGFLGLRPDDLWTLSIWEFGLIVDGWQQREEYETTKRANEVVQSIIGYRDKRPNLRRIRKALIIRRESREGLDLTEAQKRILAQSHKRVREQKSKEALKKQRQRETE